MGRLRAARQTLETLQRMKALAPVKEGDEPIDSDHLLRKLEELRATQRVLDKPGLDETDRAVLKAFVKPVAGDYEQRAPKVLRALTRAEREHLWLTQRFLLLLPRMFPMAPLP
jgi:hypothetical protein